jgi:hypothetical protein
VVRLSSVLRAVEAGVGQQLFNQRLQLADIAVQRLRFRLGEVLAHLQTIAQAHQRRPQLMGDAVDQLLFAGDRALMLSAIWLKATPSRSKLDMLSK